MPLYQNVVYGEDTYGDRIRGEIPLECYNTGYWRDSASGRMFAKWRINVGPLPEYPKDSRILIMAATNYFPSAPERAGITRDVVFGGSAKGGDVLPIDGGLLAALYVGNWSAAFSEQWSDQFDTMRELHLRSYVRVVDAGWQMSFTEKDFSPIPINAVLYVRVFVQETDAVLDDGTVVEMPWDVRGETFGVMAGNYGGIPTALKSLPATLLTDGEPFAPIVTDPVDITDPTALFVSTLGFLADSIQTDGALIIDNINRLHPNMVFPLLKSFGATPVELAALSDKYLSDRSKSLLHSYRAIQASRGRVNSLREYVRVLTGYECDVGPVENLIATLGDSSPVGPFDMWWDGTVVGSGMMFSNCTVGSVPDTNALKDGQVQDIWLAPAMNDVFYDEWTPDVWLDYWGGYDDLVGTGAAETPFLGAAGTDDWTPLDDYTLLSTWMWRVSPTTSSSWMGTVSNDGVPDYRYCEPLQPLHYWITDNSGYLRWRCRAKSAENTGQSILMRPQLIFLDERGDVLSTVSGTQTPVGYAYEDLELTAAIPADAAYVAWRLLFQSTGQAMTVAGIELRHMGQTSGPYEEIEDGAYRDPRSIIITVHTPYVPATDTKVIVNDDTALVEDTLAAMNMPIIAGRGTMRKFDAIVLSKLDRLLRDAVPTTVNYRILLGSDAEYARRFPDRAHVLARTQFGTVSYLSDE